MLSRRDAASLAFELDSNMTMARSVSACTQMTSDSQLRIKDLTSPQCCQHGLDEAELQLFCPQYMIHRSTVHDPQIFKSSCKPCNVESRLADCLWGQYIQFQRCENANTSHCLCRSNSLNSVLPKIQCAHIWHEQTAAKAKSVTQSVHGTAKGDHNSRPF